MLRAKWGLCRPEGSAGQEGGVLLANPIPADAEISRSEIDPHIQQALSDMDALGIRGKDTTPYLLGRIVEITSGRSLTANIALVKNNAVVAAQVAEAYAGQGLN